MAVEIERKFLVNMNDLPILTDGQLISQGYIATADNTTVRLRVKGDKGFVTLKGETVGLSRLEYEYEIPVVEAIEMIDTLCLGRVVSKTRYELPVGDHVWELDVFHGANQGLVVAEVELADEHEEPDRPSWLGQEVTGQVKYYNSRLIRQPYSQW